MMTKKAAAIFGALASNEDESHASVLCERLGTTVRFICIVAFARMSGLNMILKPLEARIAAGMKATFVVGIDFFQTEPALLEKLLGLKKAAKSPDNVLIYMGTEDRQYTMHPKVYLFVSKDGSTVAVVGSANMTNGGFEQNHEFSAVMTGRDVNWEAELNDWIDTQVEAGELIEADPKAIKRYADSRAIYLPHIQIAQRRARRAIQMPPGDLDTLRAILATMMADNSDDGFDAQVARRAAANVMAAKVLTDLAQPKELAENEFLELYEKLVSGLWHSGGLHRGKTIIAQSAGRFQQALRDLNDNKSNDPRILFEQLRKAMENIPRAGVNVISEILHTRDKKRFPVMNQNSISGMSLARINGYPLSPTKQNINGNIYKDFCAHAENIRSGLGLSDFSELDALFNYAYWADD